MSKYGYSQDEYRIFNIYALRFLLCFAFLYCFMYCTRTNLSNITPILLEDMKWSKADIGILSSVYFWAYGIGQLINGRFVEIYSSKKIIVISVLVSCISNILFGLQSNIFILSLLWGINGYFQSMAWPAGMYMLSKWWPGDRKGFATGFSLGLSGFGQVVTTFSVILGLKLFPNLGWRVAFFIPVLFPLITLLFFMLFLKPSPESVGLKEFIEHNDEKANNENELKKIVQTHGVLYPYIHLLKNKKYIIWVFVACIQGLIRYGLVSWIPLYYYEKFNVDVVSSLIASLALPVGMGLGTFIVPVLTDKFCPNNRLAAASVSGVIATISILIFLILDPRINYQLALIECLLFIGGFAIYAVTGCIWAFSSDIGGRVFSGTSAGILNFSQYVGAAIQSIIYGFILDKVGWEMVLLSIAFLNLIVAIIGIRSRLMNKI